MNDNPAITMGYPYNIALDLLPLNSLGSGEGESKYMTINEIPNSKGLIEIPLYIHLFVG